MSPPRRRPKYRGMTPAEMEKRFAEIEDRLIVAEQTLEQLMPEMISLRKVANAMISGDQREVQLALSEARAFLTTRSHKLFHRKSGSRTRRWTEQAKIAILREYHLTPRGHGQRILRRYKVHTSTLHRWREQVASGEIGEAIDRLLLLKNRDGSSSSFDLPDLLTDADLEAADVDSLATISKDELREMAREALGRMAQSQRELADTPPAESEEPVAATPPTLATEHNQEVSEALQNQGVDIDDTDPRNWGN